MSYSKPFRWPRWFDRLICKVLPHRWLVGSENDWRICRRCLVEELRARNEVWKD